MCQIVLIKYQWGKFYKLSDQYKLALPKLLMSFSFHPRLNTIFVTNTELFVIK